VPSTVSVNSGVCSMKILGAGCSEHEPTSCMSNVLCCVVLYAGIQQQWARIGTMYVQIQTNIPPMNATLLFLRGMHA
jgi:hypothetical protein